MLVGVGYSECMAATQINRSMMMSEELRKRTSGQKQVFGFEGAREKGSSDSMRLGRNHDSEGANTKSLGAAALRKVQAQRSRVRLAETERELDDRYDARQRRCAPRRPRRV